MRATRTGRATYATLVGMALATLALNVAADGLADAKAYCEREWPDDFSTRKFCIDQQHDAIKQINRWAKKYGLIGMGSRQAAADVILQKCNAEWRPDFDTMAYCIEKQTEAAIELGALRR